MLTTVPKGMLEDTSMSLSMDGYNFDTVYEGF